MSVDMSYMEVSGEDARKELDSVGFQLVQPLVYSMSRV